jgi:zinc/manganese transport system ATP-binding protein
VLRSEVLSELYGTHIDVVRVHDRLVVVGGGQDELEHVDAS